MGPDGPRRVRRPPCRSCSPGSASFCAASEVARAHVAALTRGESGARYILAGTDATYRALISEIAHVTGVASTLPEGHYPEHVARAEETLARADETGELPMVDPYRMRVFAGHYLFDSARAVMDLGYRALPLRRMIRDAYDWYRAYGFIAPATDSSRELEAISQI